MNYSLIFFGATFITFFHLVLDCSAEASHSNNAMADQIDVMRENSKKKQINNLTCHVCHSEQQSACLDITHLGGELGDGDSIGFAQACGANDTACMVKRIAFTSSSENGTQPMKTVAIKRTCSAKCEPGCIIMGERTRLYVCSTCCNSPLCNIGNGASTNRLNNFSHYYSLVSIASLFMQHCRWFSSSVDIFYAKTSITR